MNPTAQNIQQNNNSPALAGSERYTPTVQAQTPQPQNPQSQTNLSQAPTPTTQTQAPQPQPLQPQPPHQAIVEPPKKSKKPLIILVLLFLIVLILTSLGGLTYAVAYEKIKLDKYPDLQKKVSYMVMEIPFMPKTPEYLLTKTALAHQSVTKQSFDISAAIDSADLTSSLGLTGLDMQAKGDVDYSDPQNVFGNLELSFTKDFNMELRKKDKMLYFKLNKLPSFLFAFLGISSESFNPLLEKWVSYDTTPLDTEARKTIQEDREVDPLSEEFVDENFQKYLDGHIFSKMQLSSDMEAGHDVHKITLNADAELIDYIGKKIEDSARQNSNYVYPQSDETEMTKLSDFVKNLKWEMYIDKETYYTRKVILSVDLEYDSSNGLGAFSMGSLMNPLPSNNSAKIALAAKFDKFGEEVIVEEPTGSITFEEFTQLFTTAMNELYGGLFNPINITANSRDTTRKSDLSVLQAFLEMYNTSNSKYPPSLSESDFGMAEIPLDPDGSSYYYKASGDGGRYDLCANLEEPPDMPTTCPDPSYNYHITSESYYY